MIKNSFKRFLVVALFVCSVFLLTACGNSNPTKALWDKFVKGINTRDSYMIGSTFYTTDSQINKFVEEDSIKILDYAMGIKTESFTPLVSCDLSTQAKPEAYYSARVSVTITDINDNPIPAEFDIYSVKSKTGVVFCSLINLDPNNGDLGNTPSASWLSKVYYDNGDFLYQVISVKDTEGSHDEITYSQQNKNKKNVVIPSEINGVPVTKIDKYAFYKYSRLITFTVKSSNLQTVEIPETVKTIGKYAFYQCGKLKEVNIPLSVTTVEANAFASCTSLKKIVINLDDSGLNAEKEEAMSVSDPNSVNEIIISGGFKNIYSGEIINLKASGEGINTANIQWSIASGEATLVKQVDNSVNLIAGKTGTVTIVAYDSENLVNKSTLQIEVVAPGALKTIDFTAFDRCSSLREIYIYATNPNSLKIGNGTKFALSTMVKIYVPKGCKAKYAATAEWSMYANQIYEME